MSRRVAHAGRAETKRRKVGRKHRRMRRKLRYCKQC
jgi:hypothetical protein